MRCHVCLKPGLPEGVRLIGQRSPLALCILDNAGFPTRLP